MRNEIIAAAKSQIGYKEKPGNDTKYGEWFGLNHDHWCMIFCMWCLDQAGYPVRGDFMKGWASVPRLLKYAKDNNLITKSPQPGDLVIYDWQGDGKADHVGVFQATSLDGILAIEGNTSSGHAGSQSNGDGVWQRARLNRFITAFIDIEKLVAIAGKKQRLIIRDHIPEPGKMIFDAEKHFDSIMKLHMINWSLEGYKRDFPTQYKAMIDAILLARNT